MGLTLSQKRAKGQSSGWGNWTSIAGADYISADNGAYVVYSANLALGGQKLTACQVKTNFVSRGSGTHAATLRCYLYTSDPTGNSSPPDGYLDYVDYSVNVPYYGVFQTFSFSGLNITAGTKLYFWFEDNNSSSTADDMYHYATGNGYTQRPAVSGTFAALPLVVTASPEELRSGETLTLAIQNRNGRTLTARIKRGSTVLATQSVSADSCSFVCYKDWFDTAQITVLDQIQLTAEVTDGTESASAYFLLDAGDDMKPIVGTPTVSIVQPQSAASFPSTYIANLSRAKVSAAVTLPTDAAVSAVVLSYAGRSVPMTLNSQSGEYEATTAGPLTGDTAFTVTATDERGLSGSNSAAVSGVVPYTLPSAVFDLSGTWRCDANGDREAGGANYRAKAAATVYTGLSGNSLRKLTVAIKGEVTETNLTPGVQSAKIAANMDATRSYTLVLTVQDQISGEITSELKLDGRQRDLVLKRNTAGTGTCLGIGKAPDHLSDGSTIELPEGSKIFIGDDEVGNPDLSPYAKTADLGTAAFVNVADLGLDGALFARKELLALANTDYYFDMSDASVWLVVTSCPTNAGSYTNGLWIYVSGTYVATIGGGGAISINYDALVDPTRMRISSAEANTYVWLIPLP